MLASVKTVTTLYMNKMEDKLSNVWSSKGKLGLHLDILNNSDGSNWPSVTLHNNVPYTTFRCASSINRPLNEQEFPTMALGYSWVSITLCEPLEHIGLLPRCTMLPFQASALLLTTWRGNEWERQPKCRKKILFGLAYSISAGYLWQLPPRDMLF